MKIDDPNVSAPSNIGCRPQVQGRDTRRRDRGVRVGLDAAHHRPGQPVAVGPGREMRSAQHWRSGEREREREKLLRSCIATSLYTRFRIHGTRFLGENSI